MIEYRIGVSVEAFTAGRGEDLPFPVIQVHQVHGCEVAVINDPSTGREELEGYDALVTDMKDCAIGVRTADCVPVLLYDPCRKAVAAVHAGWRGTLLRICRKALLEMQCQYGTLAEDVRAVIGPSICAKCFQVGEEVVSAFKDADFILDGVCSWGGERIEGNLMTGYHIDLVEVNRRILIESGVQPDNIQVSGICTYENAALYSARRDGGHCGRNISGIVLRQKVIGPNK